MNKSIRVYIKEIDPLWITNIPVHYTYTIGVKWNVGTKNPEKGRWTPISEKEITPSLAMKLITGWLREDNVRFSHHALGVQIQECLDKLKANKEAK